MKYITSLADLTEKFQSMVAELDVEPIYKSMHTTPQHNGSPHVEVADGKFQFVITERGSEVERIESISADDVLYLLFNGITQHMATKFECQEPVRGTDGRSAWFPYQERLMENLNPAWGDRLREEHLGVLANHPLRT